MNPPNYRAYTDKELLEALASIDKDAFPENFQRLQLELACRQEVAEFSNNVALANATEVEQTKTESEEYWPKDNIKSKQRSALLAFASYTGVMFVFGLSAPVYFYSFFTHVSLYSVIDTISIAIATICFLGVLIKFYSASKKPKPNDGRLRKIFRLKSKKEEILVARLLFVPISMLLGFFVYFATAKGLLIFLHSYALEKHSTFIVATIDRTSSGLRRYGCDRDIHLTEFNYAYFDYICASRLNVEWRDLKKGDKIKLFGEQSKLGFLVKSAKVIE